MGVQSLPLDPSLSPPPTLKLGLLETWKRNVKYLFRNLNDRGVAFQSRTVKTLVTRVTATAY